MAGKLRPYEPLLMTFHRVGDGLLGAGFFLVLSWLYGMYNHRYWGVAILIFLMTLVCFHALGIYRSWRGSPILSEAHHIFWGCCAVYVLLLLTGYVLKVSHEFSRRVVLTWMVTWPFVVGTERLTIRSIFKHYRKKGNNVRRAVAAGAGRQGERLAQGIRNNPWFGIRLEGFFDDKVTEPLNGYPILGKLKALSEYVKKHNVDVVYLALTMKEESKFHWLLKELADTTASVYLVPDIFFFDLLLGGSVAYLDDFPVIGLRESPLQGLNALLKRMEDLVLASVILALISPIMLIISAGIKLTSRGPILFKQWRYGIDGRPIRVYKFRSMNVCEDGYVFNQATQRDLRVTRLGAFLRRTSLDELPQFINVIQGRMSIVGPRPHPVAMNEEYRKLVPGYMLRHKVRPGITGLAQVNGLRGETEELEKMEKRVECDLEYLRNWSLLMDLKIIARTILTNAWRTNAY